MDNIIKLYEYIKSHHSTKYISATCEQNEISIVFHRELTIKIVRQKIQNNTFEQERGNGS